MSQEQDKKENSCSAGKAFAAGLAVTAIGVGIGSALYYFFGRDDENQQQEPSTSFHAEQNFTSDEDSYVTISCDTTTDTSVHCTSSEQVCLHESDSDTDTEVDSDSDSDSSSDSDTSVSDKSDSDSEMDNETVESEDSSESSADESDSSWDVTNTLHVPSYRGKTQNWFIRELDNIIVSLTPRRKKSRKPERDNRGEQFRKRAYTLEECSVCFDVMLTDQELMTLPCTHNFHLKCISPWLERNQTCPVCRHKAD